MNDSEAMFCRECKLLPETTPTGGVSPVRLEGYVSLSDAMTAPVKAGYYIRRITEHIDEKTIVHF